MCIFFGTCTINLMSSTLIIASWSLSNVALELKVKLPPILNENVQLFSRILKLRLIGLPESASQQIYLSLQIVYFQ